MVQFNYTHNYHTIGLLQQPSYQQLFLLAKEYYIVRSVETEGGYVIIPELTANGKINTRVWNG